MVVLLDLVTKFSLSILGVCNYQVPVNGFALPLLGLANICIGMLSSPSTSAIIFVPFVSCIISGTRVPGLH